MRSLLTWLLLILYLSSYASFYYLSNWLKPVGLANFLGFAAMFFYALSLTPTMLRLLSADLRKNKMLIWLRQVRRYIGVLAFVFGSNHGYLLVLQRNINLLKASTYVEYFQGISLFFILSILAITSNNWSVRSLKSNWFKLHRLTYLIMFLLPWHILDKVKAWTFLTPLELILNLICIVLFLRRIRVNIELEKI